MGTPLNTPQAILSMREKTQTSSASGPNCTVITLILNRLKNNQKLQVLFLRASNIGDEEVKQMCHVLKPDPANPHHANKTLKVLDISYNPITKKCIKYFNEMLETNRTLEYIGLAKCKLQTKSLVKILN